MFNNNATASPLERHSCHTCSEQKATKPKLATHDVFPAAGSSVSTVCARQGVAAASGRCRRIVRYAGKVYFVGVQMYSQSFRFYFVAGLSDGRGDMSPEIIPARN
ncbi:hypothetical protein GWI33_009871 [Rhynchophorus ferrugineus]|uniref:Uncharacterized protein n=1 Tax=Rhynchophorus ferrugineus TaxID=354439 RepID=A0A834IDQ6_RHYFE|nr:hypothetical protein GWI33_009871 [Rhynchophorus ferrugineus]